MFKKQLLKFGALLEAMSHATPNSRSRENSHRHSHQMNEGWKGEKKKRASFGAVRTAKILGRGNAREEISYGRRGGQED